MNDHDGGMAAAELDDADGVLSRGAGAGPIRIADRSWYTYDGATAATSGVRSRFGLEAVSQRLQVMVVTALIIAPFFANERLLSVKSP